MVEYIDFNKKTLFYLIMLIFLSTVSAKSDKCSEIRLLDGSEDIVQYGMDSTNNWWAITAPFQNKVKMHINNFSSDAFEEVFIPTFSPDGSRWAFFARDVATWYLETEEASIELFIEEPGEIHYAPENQSLVYSYFQNTMETIVYNDEKDTLEVLNKTGQIFVNNDGTKVAYLVKAGFNTFINVNGNSLDQFDEIVPVGFWHDDSFIYAATNGNNWAVYKDDEMISSQYDNIPEIQMDLFGTFVGFIGRQPSGMSTAVLISDEFPHPLRGRNFNSIRNIVLHPYIPMMAYNALDIQNNPVVVFNNTKYTGARQTSRPYFSYDGTVMYFFGCNIDCFINMNGKRVNIPRGLTVDGVYAFDPESDTFGYATSASLVVRNLEDNTLYAGAMMNQTGSVRYNWRDGRYESLGVINNRLYMQICEF